MKIIVIGGRGLTGRRVVRTLQAQGHCVASASRSSGVDVLTGRGLATRLRGADVVVDASNSPSFEGQAAFDFFRTAGVHLLAAERQAGVQHHVALSVVGTGRLPDSPYLRGKALQERMIEDSGIPFTIVHATQFFEFLLDIVDSAIEGQVVRRAPAWIEPVASEDVAALVSRVALQPPLHGVVEIAGPERVRLSELVRRFVLDMEAPFDVRSDATAPYFGAVLDPFVLLPRQDAVRGRLGFEAWLEQSAYARADW
jgi:uncharacterized protein YbjT (DUF2867 family)